MIVDESNGFPSRGLYLQQASPVQYAAVLQRASPPEFNKSRWTFGPCVLCYSSSTGLVARRRIDSTGLDIAPGLFLSFEI
jgi:hypothetical protein